MAFSNATRRGLIFMLLSKYILIVTHQVVTIDVDK